MQVCDDTDTDTDQRYVVILDEDPDQKKYVISGENLDVLFEDEDTHSDDSDSVNAPVIDGRDDFVNGDVKKIQKHRENESTFITSDDDENFRYHNSEGKK